MWTLLLFFSFSTLYACKNRPHSEHQSWKYDLEDGKHSLIVVHEALHSLAHNEHTRDSLKEANLQCIDNLMQQGRRIYSMATTYILSGAYRQALLTLCTKHYSLAIRIDALQSKLEHFFQAGFQRAELPQEILRSYDEIIRDHVLLYETVPEASPHNWPERFTQTMRSMVSSPAHTAQQTLGAMIEVATHAHALADSAANNIPGIIEAADTLMTVDPPTVRLLEFALHHSPPFIGNMLVAIDSERIGSLRDCIQNHIPVSYCASELQAFLDTPEKREHARRLVHETIPQQLPKWASRLRLMAHATTTTARPVQQFINTYLVQRYRPYGPAAQIILLEWQKKMRELHSRGLALLLVDTTNTSHVTHRQRPLMYLQQHNQG